MEESVSESYNTRKNSVMTFVMVCYGNENKVLWNPLWNVMESHNKMVKSMSESRNIPVKQGVLGVSLTRNIVLYVQNEYLAILEDGLF